MTTLGPRACPWGLSSAAPPCEHLGEFRGVREEAGGLLDWLASLRSVLDFRPELALVAVRADHSLDLRELLHDALRPRRRVLRVLVQEVAASLQLLDVERHDELKVGDGSCSGMPHRLRVCGSRFVEREPSAEVLALGRPDQQVWLLLA